VLRDAPVCFAISRTLAPRRANTLISTACSWVNIGGPKAAILAQVGQFYLGAVGQFYIGANSFTTIENGLTIRKYWSSARR